MKRAKLLLPLISLTPVAAIAPVVLSSCSHKKSSFSSLQYGDNYELLGGDRDTAKQVAANHLLMYNSQANLTYSEFLDALHPRLNMLNYHQPVRQMDPVTFYWQMLYTAADKGYYCKIHDWKESTYKVGANDTNYQISFKSTWGTKNGSQMAWEEQRRITNAALPYYIVDENGKVNFHFENDDKVIDVTAPSYSFDLVTVTMPESPGFEKLDGNGEWQTITTVTVNASAGAFYALALDKEYRYNSQCEFQDVSSPYSFKNQNDQIYGIVSWSGSSTGSFDLKPEGSTSGLTVTVS